MKKLILVLIAVLFISSTITASNGNKIIQAKNLEINLKKYQNETPKTYLWEVESNYGKATGSATSLEKANEMIALVGKKDVTTYKIIISQ